MTNNNDNDMNVLDFDMNIHTVKITTDFFTAEAIELYELPAEKVSRLMKFPGPEQIGHMTKLFKLALVNPAQTSELELLSFNQMATVLFDWYNQSQIRIPGMESGVKTKADAVIDPPVNGFGDERDDELDFNMDFDDLPPNVQEAIRNLMRLKDELDKDSDDDATS
jgi:hypothetical protein